MKKITAPAKTLLGLLFIKQLKSLVFFLFLFAVLLLIPMILLASLPSFPLAIFTAFLISIMEIAIGSKKIPRISSKKQQLIELETRILNRPLFIFEKLLQDPDRSDKINHYYQLDQKMSAFIPSFLVREFLLIFFLTLGILLSGIGIARSFFSLSNRIEKIRNFYKIDPLKKLPHTYTQNKDLRIHLPFPTIRHWSMEIANTRIFSKDKTLTIPSPLLKNTRTEGILTLSFQGFSRRFDWKAQALQAFVPKSVKFYVHSVLGTQLYSNLRDLEVWPQTKLQIFVQMSESILSIQQQNPSHYQIHGSNFIWQKNATRPFSESLILFSEKNQSFAFPKFKVNIRSNRAPTLKLLFPIQSVFIQGFPWKVEVLLKAQDDLAIKSFHLKLIVSNQDPDIASNYTYTNQKSFSVKAKPDLIFRSFLESRDFILLPGDVIQASYRAQDALGKFSKAVKITLIFPDSETKQTLREQTRTNLRKNIDKLSRYTSKKRQNTTRQSIQKELEQLVKNEEKFQKFSQSEVKISEIEHRLQKIKEITDILKKTDWLQSLQNKPVPSRKTQKEITSEQLEQLKELLHQLETLQKATDWIRKLKETESLFKKLESSPENFQATRQKYRSNLQKLKKTSPLSASTLEQLIQESQKLTQNKAKSFKKSKELWEKLKQNAQEELQKFFKKTEAQNEQKISDLEDEAFLRQLLYEKSITQMNFTNTRLGFMKALNESSKDSSRKIQELFHHLLIDPNTRKQLLTLSKIQEQQMQDILTALRDHQMLFVRHSLESAARINAQLYFELLQLKKKTKQRTQGKPSSQQSLSLDDLLKMQNKLSKAMQQLLQQSQGKKLSPADKEQLQKLAKLQEEIQKNLEELLKKSGNNALSGGQEISDLMEDISKKLKSYQLSSELIRKSKKIEEKIKKGKKSLKEKGLSKTRRSENPETYLIQAPPRLQIQKSKKQDRYKIKKTLPAYYHKLLKKIRQNSLISTNK